MSKENYNIDKTTLINISSLNKNNYNNITANRYYHTIEETIKQISEEAKNYNIRIGLQ